MTEMDLILYYANLLIIQYNQKPKASATIQATAKPFIMNKLALDIQSAYNIDTAIGVQLDVLGEYIGLSRNAQTFTGPVTLDDNDYRTLLKVKTVENSSKGSLYDIQQILTGFFGDDLLVFDYADMSLDYFFNSSIGSETLAEVFVKDGLLPKPMGVGLRALIYAPNITSFFSLRTYDYPIVNGSTYNTYDDYEMDRPFLTYDYAITE